MNNRTKAFSPNKSQWLDRFIQWWRFSTVRNQIFNGAIVCDLGCGSDGNFLKSIAERISFGIGIDGYLHENKNAKIVLKKGDLSESFSLESESFDIAVSFAVLEHLTVPKKFLSESYRILKKGGVLFLTTPAPSSKIILETLSILGFIDRNEILDHKHYFTKEELIMLAKNSGFSEIRVKKFQFGFNNLLIAKK